MAVNVYGRGMWETMSAYWPTADQNPGEPPVLVEFAKIWQASPKVVVSRTLETVEGPNVRLVHGDGVDEVRRLAAETDGEISVGGATLAASLIRAGLVDEFRLYTHPVAIGAGKPYLPPGRPAHIPEARRFARFRDRRHLPRLPRALPAQPALGRGGSCWMAQGLPSGSRK